MPRYAAITGWGMAVPEQVVKNIDLAKVIDTSDEWIRTRTGIVERRVVSAGEYTSTLATKAGQRAITCANIAPADIDLVILATCTPDRPFPATASRVQADLGIPKAGAFDLNAACSGFVYGLHVASAMIRSGIHHTILLIGVDIFTHLLNWKDRNTCVLFGDGAGAVILRTAQQPLGVLSSAVGSWGDGEELMAAEAGGTRLPLTAELLEQGQHHVYMHGREIYKHAVREMCHSSQQVIAEAELTIDAIDLVVPHQANARIIEAVAKRLNVTSDRVFINLDRFGNTSAASIPIALCEAVDHGRLQAGYHVLLTAFGGGLTWASSVVRWGREESL